MENQAAGSRWFEMKDRPTDWMLPKCWKGGIPFRSAAVEQILAHSVVRMRPKSPLCAGLVISLVREELPMEQGPSQRRVYNAIRNHGIGPQAGCGLEQVAELWNPTNYFRSAYCSM